MKWFKHNTDMHTDLKVQELIDREGAEGYATWCLCLEIMGQQGKKNKIGSQLRWQKAIQKVFQWSDKSKVDSILSTMAEVRLINPKSLNYGNLHIPNYNDKLDNWTKRQLQSELKETTEQVSIDKIRIDKIREEYIKIKEWREEDLVNSDYARFNKRIKELLLKAKGNCDKIIAAMSWVSRQGYSDWTLETVFKKWPDFAKRQESLRLQAKQGQEAKAKIEQMKKEAKEHPIDSDKLTELTKGIGID